VHRWPRAAVALLAAVIAGVLVSSLAPGPPGAPGPGGATAAASVNVGATTVRDRRLASVESFALALGPRANRASMLDRLSAYDLVVLDGIDAPPALVEGLRARGVLVLGYLSVGTIERGRPWSARARPARLDRWPDWDEWYADVADEAFRSLITDRVAPGIVDRGFDGLFLDNVDMIETHPARADGMRALVAELSDLVHARNGLLFAQNGEAIIEAMLPDLDGWNREDVSTAYDFDAARYRRASPRARRVAQRALRRIGDGGVLVTATDYVAAGDHRTSELAVATACAAGAVPYVSDISLNRVPREPPRC
jgi:uncharacterized protein (TIGR01370 family)